MYMLTKSWWPEASDASPRFEIRPLSGREALEFKSLGNAVGFETPQVYEHVFKGLVSWTGVNGPDGKPAEVSPENALDLLLPMQMENLAGKILAAGGLHPDPVAEKNSPSPSQSSASDAPSTAETADGAGTAAPKTRRRRRSGK